VSECLVNMQVVSFWKGGENFVALYSFRVRFKNVERRGDCVWRCASAGSSGGSGRLRGVAGGN
jgi:hypothetical protein